MKGGGIQGKEIGRENKGRIIGLSKWKIRLRRRL